jgi:peptidyl-tRNA hydrolase, PTH1 family
MKLIVGLGNPGDKYEKTRHNAGWLFVDYIQNEMSDLFSNWHRFKKLEADISEAKVSGEEITLVKPQTYMNDSGRAVKNIAIMHKLQDLHDLYIIHDDFDINIGKYKIQSERGSAGHNGVQSIIDYMKTNGFNRIRLGIHPHTKIFGLGVNLDAAKFVLKKFSQAELKLLYKKTFPAIKEKIISSS